MIFASLGPGLPAKKFQGQEKTAAFWSREGATFIQQWEHAMRSRSTATILVDAVYN